MERSVQSYRLCTERCLSWQKGSLFQTVEGLIQMKDLTISANSRETPFTSVILSERISLNCARVSLIMNVFYF